MHEGDSGGQGCMCIVEVKQVKDESEDNIKEHFGKRYILISCDSILVSQEL